MSSTGTSIGRTSTTRTGCRSSASSSRGRISTTCWRPTTTSRSATEWPPRRPSACGGSPRCGTSSTGSTLSRPADEAPAPGPPAPTAGARAPAAARRPRAGQPSARRRIVHHRERDRTPVSLRPELRAAAAQRGGARRLVLLQDGRARLVLRARRAAERLRALLAQQRLSGGAGARALSAAPRPARVVRGKRRSAAPEAPPAAARGREPALAAREHRRPPPHPRRRAAEDGAARRQLRDRDEPRRAPSLRRANGTRTAAAARVRGVSRRPRLLLVLHLPAWQRSRHAPHMGSALPPHGPDRDAQPADRPPSRPADRRSRRLVVLPRERLHTQAVRAADGILDSGRDPARQVSRAR